MAVAFEGGLVLAGAALGWLMTPPAWDAAHWTAEAALLGTLWSLPPLVALVYLRQLRTGAVRNLNRTVDELLVPLFAKLKLCDIAAAVGMSAAGASEGGRFMPRDVGSHVVAVSPVGRPDAAEEFLLDVTDT